MLKHSLHVGYLIYLWNVVGGLLRSRTLGTIDNNQNVWHTLSEHTNTHWSHCSKFRKIGLFGRIPIQVALERVQFLFRLSVPRGVWPGLLFHFSPAGEAGLPVVRPYAETFVTCRLFCIFLECCGWSIEITDIGNYGQQSKCMAHIVRTQKYTLQPL